VEYAAWDDRAPRSAATAFLRALDALRDTGA